MKISGGSRAAVLALAGLVTLATIGPARAAYDGAFFAGLKARSLGPAGMGGRVAAIDALVRQPDVIYVGAATGGLWKSEDGGISWKPIFDDHRESSIGAVTVFQPKPEIVWAGTGEGNPRNSAGVGRGIYKSTDGGKSWTKLGLEMSEHISRIVLHPSDPEVAWVATMGTTWAENPERGLYKTTDGGKTWKQVLYVDARTGAADLVIDPSNPKRLFAAMWEHRRWPWAFKSGGPGSGLYVSEDGGETWKKLGTANGLPAGELGRIGLAVAPSNPKVVYALVEAKKNVLLRSDDGGNSFKPVNTRPDVNPRPFYFSDIEVNPKDENTVYRLQVNLDVSTDGGKTFKPMAPRGIHSDHHALWIGADGNTMVEGSDGGVAISRDRGKHWQFVDNLPLGQFYHVAVDNEKPYNIYGGLQDNGSWRGPSTSYKPFGVFNASWEAVGFGDGFGVLPDPENSDFGYAMSQGGNLIYFNQKTGVRKAIRPTETDVKHRYNWNAAIALDPFDPKTVYYGSQFVHKSPDRGNTWQIISPDLTTNDPEKQKQDVSGGLTRDVTAAENHCTILSISPSPKKKGVIWVGTDDGNVQLTTDGGKTWSRVSDILVGSGLVSAGTWVPHVEASPSDPATAYAVFDDHRRSNWKTYVFVTRDYGKSWQNLATPEIDGYAHVVREDPVKKDLLYLGTEFGLYVSFDGGRAWRKWTEGLPTVPVTDLIVHRFEHDLIIGTHGRGIYILDDIRPLRALSDEIASAPLHLFPVADAEQYHFAPNSGPYLFPGDGLFRGRSRPYGALLTYVLNGKDLQPAKAEENEDAPPEKKDDKKKEEQKLDIEIIDAAGKPVRTLKAPMKLGINRIAWDLRREKYEVPRYPLDPERAKEREREERERTGIQVLPGRYTARIRYAGRTETASFEVKPDPRFVSNPVGRRRSYEIAMQSVTMLEALAKAYTQLVEARTQVGAALGNEQKLSAPLATRGRELAARLADLADRIAPNEVRQGIYDRTAEASAQLTQLIQAVQSSYDGPNQPMLVRYDKTRKLVDGLLAEVESSRQATLAFQQELKAAGFGSAVATP